ncbi:MAG: hypothetical protein M3Z09_17535 [Acidobacteriota bacterium]|nr:hypothetical protein [Acidobacteriota bacterium]
MKVGICLWLLAVSPVLRADFTYESTTKITGGALVGMMKFAGAFSKDARKMMDAIPSTAIVQGSRMAHRSADSATVIDLDKETVTNIDYAKKTYSVMTFAQMKQAMDDMAEKMANQKGGQAPDMQFDVKMKDTGQTKTINGNTAHQMVMTMVMQGSDAKSGAKGGIDVTTDIWIAPSVAGYDEVKNFSRRMSQKLAWSPAANPLISRPDMQRAMAELYKEGSKMDGMPVYQTMKMGGSMEGIPQGSAGEANASGNGRNAGPPPASVSEALGSALGGRLGLGGFGRKKKDAPTADAGASTTSASSAAPGDSVSGSLMEMTTEVVRYSSGPADTRAFEIPSGFSQIQEDLARQNRRGR